LKLGVIAAEAHKMLEIMYGHEAVSYVCPEMIGAFYMTIPLLILPWQCSAS
jgi:hypothetical protein